MFESPQVCHLRREEAAGFPAGQRGSASEAQESSPARRSNAKRHGSVSSHRPAAQAGSSGLVSVSLITCSSTQKPAVQRRMVRVQQGDVFSSGSCCLE